MTIVQQIYLNYTSKALWHLINILLLLLLLFVCESFIPDIIVIYYAYL